VSVSRRKFAVLTVVVVLAWAALPARAEVKVPPVISSHMVLQQGVPVPIWGTAAPGEKVTVKFRDQQKTAEADAQGKWIVKLDPLQLGDPASMTIAGTNTLTIEDVMVGEVWVGSGQSNMDMGVGSYTKGDEVLAKLAAETYPKIRLIRCGRTSWQEATPQNIQGFSAMLFSFGVPLQKELNVPVGLMVGAVGGTPSGRWLSEEMFNDDAACKEMVAKAKAAYSPEEAKKTYEEQLAQWEKDAAAAKQAGKKEARKPRAPQAPGECEGKFGSLYQVHIQPFVPYAMRGVLWDQGESGTAVQGVDQYTVMGALIRGWRKAWGQGDFPFIQIQKPSGGGCAWNPEDPITCKAEKFAPLPEKPAVGGSAYLENHLRINQYPNTYMAMAGDLGSGIHPTNKSGYGARASRVALAVAYGKKVEYYGPLYQSHKVEGGKVRVSFTHIGQGLAFKHGEKLQGFAVAGEDKVFHWADAAIDGETVVLNCDKVAAPAAVRYAWNERHPWANLFNKDGLPALPFRTDAW
jgi:sialate O-acetylesterase